jgi:hypothetical protein
MLAKTRHDSTPPAAPSSAGACVDRALDLARQIEELLARAESDPRLSASESMHVRIAQAVMRSLVDELAQVGSSRAS